MIDETEDFAISQLFEAAVYAAVEARWSDERIREEVEAALASSMEPE